VVSRGHPRVGTMRTQPTPTGARGAANTRVMSAEHDTPGKSQRAAHEAGAESVTSSPPADLARQLTGNLPCVNCRYNLRGLSVKAVCPECGTPVRAAILAAVDPYAAILQRVDHPRLTAAGLLVWSGAALLAALLTWGLRIGDLASMLLDRPLDTSAIARAAVLCIGASGAGAMVLVRPHARISPLASAAAAIGVAGTFALGFVYARVHLQFDPRHVTPYLHMGLSLADRSALRLLEAGLLLVILFALRPNARLLAARSLLLRLGRVDRQTMLAMAAAVGLGAIGDALQMIGAPEESVVAANLGLFMIVVGSMLFTLGLFGVLADVLRIVAVLLRPSLAPSQVVGPESAPLHPAGGRP
jgi:hypothetical protein